ncbi:MAG: trypsin-like peptidase domain-containing protein [Burkholderiaceae bacterium]|nr:trypsin-like peptidase domain-containing protein [Burkholderiaceae bacterium]
MRGLWPRGLAGLLAAIAAVDAACAESKDVKLPADVSVAIYMPAQVRRFHGFGGVFESGRTLEDTVLSAGQVYFSKSRMAEAGADDSFGLLLALHPQVKAESGRVAYTLDYAVFAASDDPLLKGTETVTVDLRDFSRGGPLDVATYQAAQQVMSAVVGGLRPDSTKYPATLDLKSRSLEFAVKKDKPWASGTGFYFNGNGQVLTAAHVIQECAKIEVKRDEKVVPAKVIATSSVIDVAALDTGATSPAFLSFRRNLNFELGESVTNVGFPLQDILSQSPNLTRGNISARGGLTGSEGQIQFSAPVQPGSSGGPVVSDGGEVLGITVGTLSAAALAKQGVIPQNVNFALDSRYAVKFLQKNNLQFNSVEENPHGDIHTANQAALGAVVSVRCYE